MGKKEYITVDGTTNNWYEKVIFVVDKERKNNVKPMDLVKEAERIINDYILDLEDIRNGNPKEIEEKKKDSPQMIRLKQIEKDNNFVNKLLYSSIFLCIVMLGYVLARG